MKYFISLFEHFDFNMWFCMECKHRIGPHRVSRCPRCGSEEVENLG